MLTFMDASLLAELQRRNLTLEAISLAEGDELAIAAITASDLLRGVHAAATAEQRSGREAYIERLLELVPVIPFDHVAARIHARLRTELAGNGKVGANDLIIAATAMAHGARLATCDLRTFEAIPGLALLRC